MELAIEARGRKEGRAEGLIEMGLALHVGADIIMESLVQNFDGSQTKAQEAFRAYLEEYPADGLYLAGTLPWLKD